MVDVKHVEQTKRSKETERKSMEFLLTAVKKVSVKCIPHENTKQHVWGIKNIFIDVTKYAVIFEKKKLFKILEVFAFQVVRRHVWCCIKLWNVLAQDAFTRKKWWYLKKEVRERRKAFSDNKDLKVSHRDLYLTMVSNIAPKVQIQRIPLHETPLHSLGYGTITALRDT